MTPFDGKCQNLQSHPINVLRSLIISKILTYQNFDLQKVCQGHIVQFYNENIRWIISKSTKVIPCIFMPAVTISEIVMFQIFYLQNVGQRHGIQCLQWGHSMANVKIFNVIFWNFLIFAKVWPVWTIVTHTHTHTQTCT